MHPKVVSFNQDSVKRHEKERPVTTINFKLPFKVVNHEIKQTPLVHEKSGDNWAYDFWGDGFIKKFITYFCLSVCGLIDDLSNFNESHCY